jgi:hypothetical protein
MPRDQFIARIHAGWAHWLASIDGLTEDQVRAPGTCGEWSVKDLMGHVATWDNVALDKVRGILAGADRPDVSETMDEFNARAAAALRAEPVDALRERMTLAHAQLMGALEGMTDISDEVAQWVQYAIAEDTWQHYEEHRQVVVAFPSGDAR